MDRIEIALLDLALAIEERNVKGIYQKTAQVLFPIKNKLRK